MSTDRPTDNLITAFQRAHDGSPSSALAALNGALGANYDLTRFGQWRRGERSTPAAVQRFMRRAVLAQAFGQDATNAVADTLEPPPRA